MSSRVLAGPLHVGMPSASVVKKQYFQMQHVENVMFDRFHSAAIDLLASADKEGHVAVWRLDGEAEEGKRAERVLFLTLGDMLGEAAFIQAPTHS